MMNEPRRWKMYYISANDILEVFRPQVFDFMNFPQIDGLPDGAVVRRVHFCYERDAFGLAVEHESFDLVELGCCLPEEDGLRSVRLVDLRVVEGPVNMPDGDDSVS